MGIPFPKISQNSSCVLASLRGEKSISQIFSPEVSNYHKNSSNRLYLVAKPPIIMGNIKILKVLRYLSKLSHLFILRYWGILELEKLGCLFMDLLKHFLSLGLYLNFD